MKRKLFALSLTGFLAVWQACEAQHITEYTYCAYRVSRPREGRAHVVMRVERADISSDRKCPEMEIKGTVLRRIRGALKRNDPIAFAIPLGGEGTCFPTDSWPDAFIPGIGQHVVVLLDPYDQIEWMETTAQYDRREAECHEPGVTKVR